MTPLSSRVRRAALSLIYALASAGGAIAAPFFAEGTCALVVASRPDRAAADAYVAARGIGSQARLFVSRNGWLAISIGTLPTDEAAETIRRLKARGAVPQDAYCSTGQAYLREMPAGPMVADPSPATRFDVLFQDFDARPFTAGEKRALQAGLAYLDRYHGLLDGVWGRGSQSALETWSRAEFEGEPVNMLTGLLLSVLAEAIEAEGWRMHHEPSLGLSFALPAGLLRPERQGESRAWHGPGSLSVFADRLGAADTAQLHEAVLGEAAPGTEPYALRGADRWVTSVILGDGRTRYHRSDRRGGAWSHVAVVADSSMAGHLNLVVTSITSGRADPALLPLDGEAAWLTALALEFLDGAADDAPAPRTSHRPAEPPAAPPPPPSSSPALISTGSGFVVNAAGQVVTNHHVIEGCSSIEVDGRAAWRVSEWPEADLAVLAPRAPDGDRPHAPLSARAARLNSDVTVAGYPLSGILGGLNVTRGAVTGLSGLGGEVGEMQISAPIQSGNSGGPAFDRTGAVVGVVVSTLAPRAVDRDLEVIPQNVNFVVKADLVRMFLSANRVAFEVADGDGPDLRPEDLADHAAAVTVLVSCR